MPEAKVIGTTPANAGGILFATPASETAANVETLYAESFEHLYAIICGLPRTPRKLGSYGISAAFSAKTGTTGRRANKNAQPFPVLFLDADDVPEGSYSRVQEKLASVDSFTYITHGNGVPKYKTLAIEDVEALGKNEHRAKEKGAQTITLKDGRVFPFVVMDESGKPVELKPAGERFRALIHLDRAPSPEERAALLAWASAYFNVAFDPATKDAARIMFTPRINCRDEDIKRFHGAPLCVDKALEDYHKANPTPKRSTRPSAAASPATAFGADNSSEQDNANRWSIHPITDPSKDPMTKVLASLGLWDGEMKNNALVITCPFEHEHSGKGGKHETLYYPAGCQDNAREDLEPYKYGRFHCFHTCSERHSQTEYFEACGVNYSDYTKAINGESLSLFHGEEGRLFRTEPSGRVWVSITTKAGNSERLVCQGLEVCGSLADTKGGEHKVRIRFKDPRGRTHYGNLSRGDLVARDAQAVLKELCDNGLQLGGRKVGAYLTEYLYMAPLGFLPRYEGSNALGWVETEESGWAFVESDKTLGASGKNAEESHIIYTGRTGRAPNLSKRGTLDDWKRELAAKCLYSSRLAFAVCVAFGAPCLQLLGVEGGAFNIYGPSGKGKSSSSRMAATVYGLGDWLGKGYIRSWKASDAGFEQACLGHNDLPLILEEAVQCDQKLRGDRAYTWANGTAKGRGTVVNGEIDLREQESWRSLGLSTAEMTVEAWIKEGNPRAHIYAGQLTRLTDVYACPVSDEMGVFERVPEGSTAKEMADSIRENATRFYGTAGEAWLQWLAANRQEAADRLRAHFNAFRARLSSISSDSQYSRVLDRFALCAAAGALATELGLTGWEAEAFGPQFAERQVEACAREALKPFRAGRENIANLEKLLSLCTKDAAHFIRVLGTPATVPERPRDWYGTCWCAKTEGDPSPLDYADLGFQDEDFKGEKNAPDSSKAGAETECREMFFILRETFYGHICDKTAAAMLARWLVGKGAIVLINHGKEGEGQSRLGAKYGLGRGGRRVGYVIALDKLESLYTELTSD